MKADLLDNDSAGQTPPSFAIWADAARHIKQLRMNRLARNTGSMFAGEGARVVIQALYFIVIARQLGSMGYGIFASVLAIVAILGPFATWGWGDLLIKHVSRDRTVFQAYWGQTLYVALISGGVLCVVALVATWLIFGSAIPRALALCVAVSDLICFRIVTLCGNAYQAHERLGRTAGLQLAVSVGRLCAAALMMLVVGNRTPSQWGVLYCASTAAVALAAVGLVTKELGRPHFGLPIRRADLIEGLHFSVSLSSATIYNDVDKTMLGRLGSFGAVGIYSAAYRLIDAAFLPVRSLLFATYASFFQQGKHGIAATLALARRLLMPSLGYAFVASGLLFAIAPIVGAILGHDFVDSVSAVRFLAAIPLLRSIQVFASNALTGAGYQHWRSSLQFLVALGNVALNFLLIPAFSWRGAAMSSLVCDAVLATGMWSLASVALQRTVRTEPCPVKVSGPIAGTPQARL
jgi:O-antigen/teichoic acid export membrane protein